MIRFAVITFQLFIVGTYDSKRIILWYTLMLINMSWRNILYMHYTLTLLLWKFIVRCSWYKLSQDCRWLSVTLGQFNVHIHTQSSYQCQVHTFLFFISKKSSVKTKEFEIIITVSVFVLWLKIKFNIQNQFLSKISVW